MMVEEEQAMIDDLEDALDDDDGVLHCGCSLLQCIAVCCSVLQCD